MNSGCKLTPMMKQYMDIKKDYQQEMVLFRMGDFYEVFFEDAVNASKILNIALTHRGKVGDFKIPMAGIPHHAANAYIDRFTQHGLKVAICEQVQDPKEAVGIVERAVTQVVSPGIPYDLEKAEGREQKFLASAFLHKDQFLLAAMDFTTGDFFGQTFDNEADLAEGIRLIAPKEFIGFFGQWEEYQLITTLLETSQILPTYLSQDYFSAKFTSTFLEKLIPSYKTDKIIKANKSILSAVGALSYYICSTQKIETISHIRPFRIINNDETMRVTLPTLEGLEILPKARGSYKDSLLGFMDKTQTALGSRMLKSLITRPLTNVKNITKRQKAVEFFIKENAALETVREELASIRDLERILAKVSLNKANAGDLLNISLSYSIFTSLSDLFKKLPKGIIPKFTLEELMELEDLSITIDKTINDEIGASLEKGNLIRPGFNKKRDRLARISQGAGLELEKLEETYREKTGIPKLKIKSNNVAGYFIEVSKTHTDKVPSSFTRRQTLVNSERYTTKELAEFEKDLITAKDKLEKLEREIFKELILNVSKNSKNIQKIANAIATIDCIQSFSWIAIQENFTRPEIVSDKKILKFKGGRHPLIQSKIKDEFISHNIDLNEDQFFGLITGPNMAGKTTVMREVAIIQLLSQIGSFVPADSATLMPCDFLFSRLGASDDILKGQSTFMVEMAETSEIIRHATDKSLIILDEVGRGTSTYDGLSIAWALVEHIIDKIKAPTLFATHYHELISLIDQKNEGKNLTVETKNHNGEVQFLYNLIEEAATQSFGIYVAKLAGLPRSILRRSEELLTQLESKGEDGPSYAELPNFATGTQLSFFDMAEVSPKIPDYLLNIEEELENLDTMRTTPIEALQILDGLKNKMKKQRELSQ